MLCCWKPYQVLLLNSLKSHQQIYLPTVFQQLVGYGTILLVSETSHLSCLQPRTRSFKIFTLLTFYFDFFLNVTPLKGFWWLSFLKPLKSLLSLILLHEIWVFIYFLLLCLSSWPGENQWRCTIWIAWKLHWNVELIKPGWGWPAAIKYSLSPPC